MKRIIRWLQERSDRRLRMELVKLHPALKAGTEGATDLEHIQRCFDYIKEGRLESRP